jgi:hypothetical protein
MEKETGNNLPEMQNIILERTDRKSGNKKPEVTYRKYDAVVKLRIQVREDVLVLRRHLPFAPFVRQKTDSEKPPRVKKIF